ncbi:hypothetical protein CYY_003363 [Polysphondylium violaceum]|uniref:Large ribosomal subunit protein mL52 n=1 Tax=Polysphondylium violaceum TaxID=133409 RepID=A0A8J4PYK6_9MYCE|nr:hypothetical protein CYY_003363 [Polysphondylium violaceum]
MNIIKRSIALQSSVRQLTRAGESYRLAKGVARSGNEDGPLHDLPDFHFADGRPTPVTEKQQKWMKTRENQQNILNRIKAEVEAERQVVIDQIQSQQEKIVQSITKRKEKKKKENDLFSTEKKE